MKYAKMNIASSIVILLLSSACTSNTREQQESKDEQSTPVNPVAKTNPVFEDVDTSVKERVNSLLESYFQMIHALEKDNETDAKENAKKIAANLHEINTSKLTNDQKTYYRQYEVAISQGLDDIARSTNLDDVREATASVSENLYQLVKAFHGNTASVYYNYCPMARDNAGAHWLSDVSEIQNPYMGQSMPHCGSTKEVLK